MGKIKPKRGFYKPKSYRLSEENHQFLKDIGKECGSLNKAVSLLKLYYKKLNK